MNEQKITENEQNEMKIRSNIFLDKYPIDFHVSLNFTCTPIDMIYNYDFIIELTPKIADKTINSKASPCSMPHSDLRCSRVSWANTLAIYRHVREIAQGRSKAYVLMYK